MINWREKSVLCKGHSGLSAMVIKQDFIKTGLFWLILALALWVRLHFVFQVDTPLKSDMASFHQRGVALLEQGSFSTGDDSRSLGASTYRPPLYPLFLAGVYKIAGPNPRAAYVAQVVLGLLLLMGMYQLALRVTPASLKSPVALTAMAAGAVYPPLIAYCGILLSEMLFITLLVWAVWFLLQPDKHKGWGWLTGLFWGLAALTRPITLPLFLGVLVILWLYRQLKPRQALQVVAIFFLTLSPWILRNYAEFHEWVLVDNSSGINLVAGNNDDGKGDYTRSYVNSWMYQDALANSRNIVDFDRRLIANNNRWIQTHPLRYAQLFFKRLGYYFVSEHEFYFQDYHWNRIPWHKTPINLTFRMVWQVLALLTLVACLMVRYPMGVCLGFAGFFFYIFPAIALYYTRYRHPAIPFVFILGALGFWALWQFLQARLQPATGTVTLSELAD